MTTHDIEQERQKFEAFMREKNPSHDLEHEFGIYRFSPVQRHWDTWQAAIEDLKRIGEAFGYGWAQQQLGILWDDIYGHAPRGRMGVTITQQLKDSRRMAWLENVAHCAGWVEDEPTKSVIRASDGKEFTGDTWRKAIDKAIRSEKR